MSWFSKDDTNIKLFTLQCGLILTTYVVVISFLVLIFSLINILIPDSASAFWEYRSAESSIRFTVATLAIFLPALVTLLYFTNKLRRQEEIQYTIVTKWLVYLSFIIGGGIVLGDAVTLLHNLLSGELTARFLLKAFLLGAVIISVLVYYVLDLKGYWIKEKQMHTTVITIAGAIMIVGIIFSLFNITSPSELREQKIDTRQIEDLQNLQREIETYYINNQVLPSRVTDTNVDVELLNPPGGRAEYQYEIISDSRYQLCADFAFSSDESTPDYMRPAMDSRNNDWSYDQGYSCFNRSVTGLKDK